MPVSSTRAELRTSLTRKTDGMLTVAGDLDYYLDLAELEVLVDWFYFNPELFQGARSSAVADSSGVLLLPTTFLDMLRLEDGSERKYFSIDPDTRSRNTGWYPAGYDIATGKRKIQMINGGLATGSVTFYFYTRDRVLMGSAAGDSPVYPLEFRDLLAMKASQLYFEDQGESYDTAAQTRERRYNTKLQKAEEMYMTQSHWPDFAQSNDPDTTSQYPLQRRTGYLN